MRATTVKSTQQCRSVKTIRGETLRCECLEGHRSVHYCGSEWWENTRGLPENGWGALFVASWAIAVLAAIIVMVAVYCLVVGWPRAPKRPPPKPRPPQTEIDHQKVFCEVSADDLRGMSEAMKWAMIVNKAKWVEARGKPGDEEHLQIITHTIPMPKSCLNCAN
jgi:hypothetical protein